VLPEVAAEMLPFYTEHYGNPSSIHRFGSAVGRKSLTPALKWRH
jgi:cysteine desulfurase